MTVGGGVGGEFPQGSEDGAGAAVGSLIWAARVGGGSGERVGLPGPPHSRKPQVSSCVKALTTPVQVWVPGI